MDGWAINLPSAGGATDA